MEMLQDPPSLVELNLTPWPQHSVANARMRMWTSAPNPSKPCAEPPGEMNLVLRPRSPIAPADLPVVSNVTPRPQPCIAIHQLSSTNGNHDAPLLIHGHSVEEYQKIYHEVVDEILRYKSGQVRPYGLELGRHIKRNLWERMDRPIMTTSVDENGRVHVHVSYGDGVYPPLYHVDTLGEPEVETVEWLSKITPNKYT